MWKKQLYTMLFVLCAPLALANCAASGSASVGEEDAAAGSSAGDADVRSSGSTSGTTQSTTTTTTTTKD